MDSIQIPTTYERADPLSSCRLLTRDGENPQKAGVKAEQSVGQNSSGAFSKDDIVTDKQFANEGLAYARDVEVTNGRWAMLG